MTLLQRLWAWLLSVFAPAKPEPVVPAPTPTPIRTIRRLPSRVSVATPTLTQEGTEPPEHYQDTSEPPIAAPVPSVSYPNAKICRLCGAEYPHFSDSDICALCANPTPTSFYVPAQLDMTQEVQLEAAMPLALPEPEPLPVCNPDVPTVDASLIVAGNNDRQAFEPVALQELADSIAAHGLAQPITVRPIAGGRFEVVAGERRFRAMQILGWSQIPALVRNLDDMQASAIMLIENLARVDLSPIDEARAYQKRMIEFSWNVADVSHFGKVTKERVKSRLSLLSLTPDIQALVQSGNLGVGYAECMVELDANRQAVAMRYFSQAKRPTIAEFRGLCSKLLEMQASEVKDEQWNEIFASLMKASNDAIIAELQQQSVKRYPTKDKLPKFTRATSTGLALEKYIALLLENGLQEDASVVGTVYAGLLDCGLARQPKESPLLSVAA